MKVYEFAEGDIGVAIKHSVSGLQIAAVRGQAADFGLRPDDHIVALNGLPVGGLQKDVLQAIIRNTPRPLAIRIDRPAQRATKGEVKADQTAPGAAAIDGQLLLNNIMELLQRGQHSNALAFMDKYAMPFILATSEASLTDRNVAARLCVMRGWLLEQLGRPDEGAQWVRSMRSRFSDDTELAWQELKLRPFLSAPDGNCWEGSISGLWDKKQARHVPLDCCFSSDQEAPVGSNAQIEWTGMRLAVLYRGHATRSMGEALHRSQGKTRDGVVFDFRDTWQHHVTTVLSPLKDAGASIETFVSVHSSHLDNEILRILKPRRWHFERESSSLQGKQVSSGLGLISEDVEKSYDFIVVLRFDLIFKRIFTEWNLNLNLLNVPFRSINDAPDYCTCLVADTVLAFPPRLITRVVRDCGPQHVSCHGLGAAFDDINIIEQGQCYNSNTGVQRDDLFTAMNPLYLLHSRYYEYDDVSFVHSPGAIVNHSQW